MASLEGLAEVGPQAADTAEKLENLASDPNGEIRHMVVPELAKMGCWDSIRRLLSSSDPLVRHDVIEKLDYANFGPEATALLGSALQDSSGEVSSYAAAKLADLGVAALPALDELEQAAALHSPDAYTRMNSLNALKRIGPRGTATIEKALQDKDETVRGWAAQLLGRP